MSDPTSGEAILRGLLWCGCGEALLALGACALLRRRERSVIGPLLAGEGTAPGRRRALAALALALLALLPVLPPGTRLPAGALLAAAAGLALVAPWPGERRLGEHGISAEGSARRFERLEAWRFGGRHLRARIGERWIAAPLPTDERREAVRERLAALAPERESAYRA